MMQPKKRGLIVGTKAQNKKKKSLLLFQMWHGYKKTREEHEPNAFVEYNAHVNMITVRCFKYGDYHGRAYYEASIYMDEKCANEKLDKVIEHLRKLREDTENEQN